MIVFRPTRRCPKCGLVNITVARRCRRCQRQLDEFDRGAASEGLVKTMQTRRRLTLVVVGLVLASVVALGIAIKWRLDTVGRFRDESRVVDADVKTLLRGARADAAALTGSFDEREFASTLHAQGPTWTSRVQTCAQLRDRVRALAPRDAEQTRVTLEIEQRLDEVSIGSAQLARAAAAADLNVARVAAARLADDGEAVTPR